MSEKGEKPGAALYGRALKSQGGLMFNKNSKYVIDTKSEKGKTEDRRATLPQTDLTPSLTTHVCGVQVLEF